MIIIAWSVQETDQINGKIIETAHEIEELLAHYKEQLHFPNKFPISGKCYL